MKLTIVGKPEEINKLIKLINEGDDVTDEFKETDEIGFLAKKSPTAIGLKNINTKEIIPQMECIGTEANGVQATYGEKGCDFDNPRDFIINQAEIMNNLKKFSETIGYSPDRPRGQQTFKDLMEDFVSWWDEPDSEFWDDLAMFYFDGHIITDKEREAL